MKYGRHRSVAGRLSALVRAEMGDVLAGADCVVPVPLHWTRHWTRGFNQAADLAKGLGLPVVHGLARARRTASQTTLSSGRRHANVKGAFVVQHGRVPRILRGRTVVLVDDVCTTGATLEACARVLVGAGVREVRAVTVARAVLGRR
ncbi:MAG: utilization protein GntX [Acidobacteria bacterium]|jgi:ComF family protein|nr:utilization protein GntX [Acidobacteriota bacterium]